MLVFFFCTSYIEEILLKGKVNSAPPKAFFSFSTLKGEAVDLNSRLDFRRSLSSFIVQRNHRYILKLIAIIIVLRRIG